MPLPVYERIAGLRELAEEARLTWFDFIVADAYGEGQADRTKMCGALLTIKRQAQMAVDEINQEFGNERNA